MAFAGMAVAIDAYGQQERAQPAQAIVVLGAKVLEGGEPSDSLRQRTMHAVTLYKRGLAHKILCTGGVGTFPPSEAQVAATLAKEQGVPPSDLLLEPTSTTTEENTRNAAAICRKHGWKQVIAVSDPYHLWRVRRDFARVGIEAFPSPALNCTLNRSLPFRALYTLRETAAVLRDVLFLH